MRRLVLCALTATALSCLSGVAVASKGHSGKAPVQEGNSFCGESQEGLAVIGSASFKRTGNIVKVTYKFTAAPETNYTLELWQGVPPSTSCFPPIGVVTTFKTNKHGKGTGKGSIEVPAKATEFFATVEVGAGVFDDSLKVTLLP
jgi:hypothetical protein